MSNKFIQTIMTSTGNNDAEEFGNELEIEIEEREWEPENIEGSAGRRRRFHRRFRRRYRPLYRRPIDPLYIIIPEENNDNRIERLLKRLRMLRKELRLTTNTWRKQLLRKFKN